MPTDTNQLKIEISRLIVKKHIDTRKKGLCAEDLIEIAHDIGLRLSHQQASEAIFFFKGGNPFHNISLNPSNLIDKKLV